MLKVYKNRWGIQYFAGLAFSGAFISAMFPFPGLTLIPYLPFLLFLVLRRHVFSELGFTRVLWLLGFVSLYYIFWLTSNPGSYSQSVVIRLVYFYALAFVFVFGRVTCDPARFMRGFWGFLLPLSVISACVGIVKVALQSRGFILGPLEFFYAMAGIDYPYGSSLISDYNIYSASLMVAAVGFVLRVWRSDNGVDWRSVTAIAIILLNLYMCGSRRSYVLLSMLYVVLCFFVVIRESRKTACGFFIISLSIFLLIYVLSEALISSRVVDHYKVVFPVGLSFDFLGTGIFTYRPQDLISSMSADQSFGLSSRLVRWKFAVDLLERGDWLSGGGFLYQDEYSCRFSGCRAIDYPHNIFLSEWLLAGVLGFISMVVLFFMMLFELVRRRKEMVTSGVLLILLVVLPGTLISGDGVFSVPQVLAAIMMTFIYSSEKNKT